jgi:DNA-binding response OmpR family regulator
MRVLIVEDDAALASFVRKGLEAEHYVVDVAADGEQARAMATEFDYDLLTLDLILPRTDGIAILRHLRPRKPSLPILVLTAKSRAEDRVQCLDLGADDFLAKPFSFSELSARIRALLRRSHLPAAGVLSVADLKIDRIERRVERARQTNRTYFQRIWPLGIPHAECRTAGDAGDDHRARVESLVRYFDERDRCVRKLWAAGD